MEVGRTNNWQGSKNLQYTPSVVNAVERSMITKPLNNARSAPISNSRIVPYQPPHKRLTQSEIEDIRAKGLCFWYEDKYTFGHKCTNKRLYTLVLELEEEVLEEVQETDNTGEIHEEPIVSLHALHGVGVQTMNQTMKLTGYYKKKKEAECVSRYWKYA